MFTIISALYKNEFIFLRGSDWYIDANPSRIYFLSWIEILPKLTDPYVHKIVQTFYNHNRLIVVFFKTAQRVFSRLIAFDCLPVNDPHDVFHSPLIFLLDWPLSMANKLDQFKRFNGYRKRSNSFVMFFKKVFLRN